MKVGDLVEMDWIHFSLSPQEREHPPVYGIITKVISDKNVKYDSLHVRWLNHPRIGSHVQDIVETRHVTILSAIPWKVTLTKDEIKEIEQDVRDRTLEWEKRLCLDATEE